MGVQVARSSGGVFSLKYHHAPWPSTFGGTQNDALLLRESDEEYAFYSTPEARFTLSRHGVEVRVLYADHDPSLSIVEVKHLCTSVRLSRTWPERWLILRRVYYPTLDRLLRAMRGETERPKGARRPRPIQPMTPSEIQVLVKKAEACPQSQAPTLAAAAD